MSPLFIVLVVVGVQSAPLAPPKIETIIEEFLQDLYEKLDDRKTEINATNIYDQMQGDQPPDNKLPLNQNSTPTNMSEYSRLARIRARDQWIQLLKENMLRQIGRSGPNVTKLEDRTKTMNMTMLSNLLNGTIVNDDYIPEKIRSYYPSCDVPSTMDQEAWKDDNAMNLFFNNFQPTDNAAPRIATATLRLYRHPDNATKSGPKPADCDSSAEDAKRLRVSIYWYTRSNRKKKVKRTLCDSRVIDLGSKWVELNVKPATLAWSHGRNLGLGVVVDDQEGTVLKASRFFKGALCTVGASTPKPIPTIILDAARQSNELSNRLHSLLGGNSTAAQSSGLPLLPSIDVCTFEFPANHSHLGSFRPNVCQLRAPVMSEPDRFERVATLSELLSNRHIRHQRQHLKNDLKIVNKRVLSTDELQALKLNMTVDR